MKKINPATMMFLALLTAVLTFPCLAAEDSKTEPFTGRWVFEPEIKNPKKPSPIRIASATLVLRQNGEIIKGSFDYITVMATRIRSGFIKGEVKNGKAVVEFYNKGYSQDDGKAEMVIKDGKLHWKMLPSPGSITWMPAKAVFEKKPAKHVKGKNNAH